VVCHSAWAQIIFGPVVTAARLPLALWLHGPVDSGHWLLRLAKRVPPDIALCNSRFTASTLSALYPRVRGEVVHCPVDLSAAGLGEGERAGIRAELHTPEDAVVIIQASRMEALKGHAVLLRVLGDLRDLPGWVCWIVGGAQRPEEVRYLAGIEQLAAELGIMHRLRFAGQRSDVPRLLDAADIHCQPNTGPDAFGIAFVEALRAGLPCVTTALGGAPEVVDARCGILVPPGDPAALATALHGLIVDEALRRRLGAAGPARARKLCDPSEQIPRLYHLLAGLRREPSVAPIGRAAR
ncbi:MAG: glycosyltransferase family 4 protein, partial [Gemmatimonadota bacterium]|nr:glycosyltransferase family 4 protein [Gemmatimonadota bacterium]